LSERSRRSSLMAIMMQQQVADGILCRTSRALGALVLGLLIVLQPSLALASQSIGGSSCGASPGSAMSQLPTSSRACCCPRVSEGKGSSGTEEGPRIGRVPCLCNIAPAPVPAAPGALLPLAMSHVVSGFHAQHLSPAQWPLCTSHTSWGSSRAFRVKAPPPPCWSLGSTSSGAWTLQARGMQSLLALFAIARS